MKNDWPFKTVIAYDTYASAIRAKELAERVAGQMECEVDAWPFGLLAVRSIREQAIAVAAAADMIILAVDVALELPRSVKDWIEGGLGGKGQRRVALVALLDDGWIKLGKPPPLCTDLIRIAHQGNAEFFCNLDVWRNRDAKGNGDLLWDPGSEVPDRGASEYFAIGGRGIDEESRVIRAHDQQNEHQ